MLRLGSHIRLTSQEVERFTRISGYEPLGVKTLDELDDYIRQCKDQFRARYGACSTHTRFLFGLLDEEYLRCFGSRRWTYWCMAFPGERIRLLRK